MRSPRLGYAADLTTDIRTALDTAELDKVAVTINALEIPSGARHGIVVITPPDLTFTTFSQTEVAWQLVVVAGPADNLANAWTRLDEIVAALQDAQLDMESATSDMFAPKNGPQLPGYAITLTPQPYNESE